MAPSLVVADLSFAWPGRPPIVDHQSVTLEPGRVGVVGANGSGKTTLLGLLVGDLTPTSGRVAVEGRLGYLPQHLPLAGHLRVVDALGVGPAHDALRSIEAGEVDAELFDTVEGWWDLDARLDALLGRLGLDGIELDRTLDTLSGGEIMLVGLAGVLLTECEVLVLDEPTNNLDRRARGRIHDLVESWSGLVVVVSHDDALLRRVDRVVEVADGRLRVVGGDIDHYDQVVEAEREVAERRQREASASVRRQEKELAESRIKLDRRLRTGAKAQREKRVPGALAQLRKRSAQESAGKLSRAHRDAVDEARQARQKASWEARSAFQVRIDLPETEVPARRIVARLDEVRLRTGTMVDLEVRGPERIGLIGANGAGKTTLIRTLLGRLPAEAGTVEVTVPTGYLAQRRDGLDPDRSVVDNVAAAAPSRSVNEIRAQLARFGLGDGAVTAPARSLSGGQRFLAGLARVLLADPAPRLLVVDEPTNDLDRTTVAALRAALSAYRGALLVISHDDAFLASLALDRTLELDADGLVDVG